MSKLAATSRWLGGLVLALGLQSGLSQGSAFTYQGRLLDSGVGANGVYDLRLTLYDAAAGGSQVGSSLTNLSTSVSNGLFTTSCDFGSEVFTGPGRWLEVAVRTNGADAFIPLLPRQPLTATPYASFAAGVDAGGIRGVIPAGSAGVVAALNGSATNLTVSGCFSGSGAGLTNGNGAALADTGQLAAMSNSLGGAIGTLQRSAPGTNVFNVRAYGATGNSVTIDSAAIRAAWNDWARYGGTLYFPKGIYKDTNTYSMPNEGEYKIRGDGQFSSVWLAWNLNNQVFVEAPVDVTGLTFQQGSGSGFNIGFKNMASAFGLRLDDVRFLNWKGIGWETDCAGCQGIELNFTGNQIGLRLAGYADGGTFLGRLSDNFVGIEVGGTDLGSGQGQDHPYAATHGNMFRFEGPRNVYPYVVGQAACCTIEGYYEVANQVVSIGYPPEVATLVPGITETNTYTQSVVVQNLGGFGGTNQPNSAATALVAIYTPACYGLSIRNTTFLAKTLVLSTLAGGDATPVTLENAVPGDGPVITLSDGSVLPSWLPANLPQSGEINTSRRFYSGTNLLFDVNSAPYLVGQSDPSWLSSPDPDASSFCARAGVTDLTQQTAISKLVKDLKAAGLWSKWYFLYPFVGGTAGSTAVNLVSTNYTISWTASPAPLFSALGVTGVTNAPGAYGDTHFNPNTAGVGQDDFSVFAYNLTARPAFVTPPGYGVFLGVRGGFRAGLGHDSTTVRVDGLMNDYAIQSDSEPSSLDLRGPLLASRSSSSARALYTDWIPLGQVLATASAGVPNANMFVLAKNDGGPYMPTGATLAMAGAGHGFSAQDWSRLRAICDNFNALLGRKAP